MCFLNMSQAISHRLANGLMTRNITIHRLKLKNLQKRLLLSHKCHLQIIGNYYFRKVVFPLKVTLNAVFKKRKNWC